MGLSIGLSVTFLGNRQRKPGPTYLRVFCPLFASGLWTKFWRWRPLPTSSTVSGSCLRLIRSGWHSILKYYPRSSQRDPSEVSTRGLLLFGLRILKACSEPQVSRRLTWFAKWSSMTFSAIRKYGCSILRMQKHESLEAFGIKSWQSFKMPSLEFPRLKDIKFEILLS